MAEPHTPPMSVLSTTLTCARPPYICPVIAVANFTSRFVIPVSFIKLPAKINIGMASSAKFCVSERTRCTGMVRGRLGCCRKKMNPEMPMAKVTGIPSTSKATNTTKTHVMSVPPRLRQASRAWVLALEPSAADSRR